LGGAGIGDDGGRGCKIACNHKLLAFDGT